jgi:hypothetical protein
MLWEPPEHSGMLIEPENREVPSAVEMEMLVGDDVKSVRPSAAVDIQHAHVSLTSS